MQCEKEEENPPQYAYRFFTDILRELTAPKHCSPGADAVTQQPTQGHTHHISRRG